MSNKKDELRQEGYNALIVEEIEHEIDNLVTQLGLMGNKRVEQQTAKGYMDYLNLQRFEIHTAARRLTNLYKKIKRT